MSKEKRKSRLSNLSQEEIFKQKIALRQCLWGYFLEVNKGEALSDNDRQFVFDQFEANAEFAEEAFSKMNEERSSHSDMAADLRDEVMEILNARNMKQLKKIRTKIEEGTYTNAQRKYLKKLYIKRKSGL